LEIEGKISNLTFYKFHFSINVFVFREVYHEYNPGIRKGTVEDRYAELPRG
jgi:hypothetical protein